MQVKEKEDTNQAEEKDEVVEVEKNEELDSLEEVNEIENAEELARIEEIKKIYITDMQWERSNIILTFSENIEQYELFLHKKKTKIQINSIEGNQASFNITNVVDGDMINKGNYTIKIEKITVKISKELVNKLDDLSRIFKYRGGFYSCEVTFKISENFNLKLNVEYMMRNRKYKKYIRICEAGKLKGKLKKILKMFKYAVAGKFYKISRIFGTDSILLLSENSDELPENLKCLKQELENDYKVKTYCKDRFKAKNKVLSYFKEIFIIAKSNTIIVENYTPVLNILDTSKKVKIIQIWHAGVGFKSVGYARFGISGSPHAFCSSHRKYDYVIVDKEELGIVYKEVFGISDSKIRVCKMPRLKEYLKSEVIEKDTKELIEMNEKFATKKTILFAPTYRGTGQKKAYYDWKQVDFDAIANFCKENNFIFIIKMHPFIKKSVEIPEEYKEYIYDYSDYSINKLIYLSDLLITDYSSCAYEFSMFNRPMIFYRYDKEIYEYVRPIHTLKKMYKEENIATNCEELIEKLELYKNVKIEDRFKNIDKYEESSYKDLIDEILKQSKE